MAAPIIAVLSFIAKQGIKAAIKKYGTKEVKKAKSLAARHKKNIEAEDMAGNYNDRINKARVTRTARSLGKEIKKNLGPDANVQDEIRIRTLLQDTETKFSEGGLTRTGHTDHRAKGLFK